MPDSPAATYHELPVSPLLAALGDRAPFVLLETSRPSPGETRSYLFLDPERIVAACDGPSLETAFRELDRAGETGLWAAGCVAYEAGSHLDPALAPRGPGEVPLLWFGLFRSPFVFDHLAGTFSPPLPFPLPPRGLSPRARPGEGAFSLGREEYLRAVARIREHIAAGDTYQVNFTMKYRFPFEGPAADLYLSMRDNQPVPYGALIKAGGWSIASASPELFFRREGARVTLRPMKGTAKRGRTVDEDARQAARLAADGKNLAENVMIVDLVRNDLGKVSLPGSVAVEDLFTVETYDSLLQMTSTVRGTLREGCSLGALMRALFPCGSVTGAPKIRTMQIIGAMEGERRGPFCGAIGFTAPGDRAVFSVPIRTALLAGTRGEMGVGSGIVADSLAGEEYRECLLKARFLTHPHPALRIIETIGWRRGEGFLFLEDHLRRLSGSAAYFGVPCPIPKIVAGLHEKAAECRGEGLFRLRLLLSRDGEAEITSSPVPEETTPLPVMISRRATDSSDPFLYHKTTRRTLYDEELRRAREKGCVEVLFTNERGELTEGSFTNLFLRRGGLLLTPPVDAGLLDGVLRRSLLRGSPETVREAAIRLPDLREADAILVGNSVRGLMAARLLPGST